VNLWIGVPQMDTDLFSQMDPQIDTDLFSQINTDYLCVSVDWGSTDGHRWMPAFLYKAILHR